MGNDQSSSAKANSNNAKALVGQEQLQKTESRSVAEFVDEGMRGQKSNGEETMNNDVSFSDDTETTSDEEVTTDDDEEEDEYDSESDIEIEAGLLERARILEDAKALKAFASFHLRPELPVTGSGACARNFFTRASAPQQEDVEVEERAQVLADLAELKKYAGYHLHPERPVESTGNGTEFGRNFFDRASAEDAETKEEMDERTRILEEAAELKKFASFHLHPERPVDPTSAACARNYFTRASAEEFDDFDDMLEREKIMEETAALKQLASWHLHPEKPVESGDGTEFGRNYFSRASAVEQESVEDMEAREEILADIAQLKKHASWHLHPEKPVKHTSDGTEFGRNFFDRASAEDAETKEEMEERVRVLEEAAELKKFASFHLHPERPVEPTSAACARNYFTRASAEEFDDFDEMLEREKILEETAALKQLASWHLHPEKPVESGDGTEFGRNYFSRASAVEQESVEDMEAREEILADLAELKKHASWHLHPEKPVEHTSDGTEFGRNFFCRASAGDAETKEEMDERVRVLEEAAELKKFASYHLHPERPVEPTAATCARNYFTRASAEEYDEFDDMLEREKIMEETAALKQLASWHLHPEKPVESGDGTEFGRNYFCRASAAEQETAEDMEARKEILADMAELKKYASWHLHPEKPVEHTSDGTEFGRNFFGRASAEERESVEDMQERTKILLEAAELKKFATFHLHPEKPVESSTDRSEFGRNFFGRASAVEQESTDEAEERMRILEEAAELKKFATFHLHPEKPVEGKGDGTACGRNYFGRPSAKEQESKEDLLERNRILEEVAMLKKFATFHLHPEEPVEEASAGTASGRNFFTRPSAPIHERIHTSGHAIVMLDGQDYDQHFVVEEESNIRDSIVAALPTAKNVSMATDDSEGKPLSRSPSDVLLFGYGEGEAF